MFVIRFGQCVSPDACNCTNKASGSECEVCPAVYLLIFNKNCSIIQCYNKLSNESDVCSSNDICTSPDHCTCINGYTGYQCSEQTFTCPPGIKNCLLN